MASSAIHNVILRREFPISTVIENILIMDGRGKPSIALKRPSDCTVDDDEMILPFG